MNFDDNNTANSSPAFAASSSVVLQLLEDTDQHIMLDAASSSSSSSFSISQHAAAVVKQQHIQRFTANDDLMTAVNINTALHHCSDRCKDCVNILCSLPPDIYHRDGDESSSSAAAADVAGPRILCTPLSLDNLLENSLVFLEAATLFNQALMHHSKSQLQEAKQIYELLVLHGPTLHNLLLAFAPSSSSTTTLLAMSMRIYNNLGLISYANENDAHQALIYFQQALLVSKQRFQLTLQHNNSSSLTRLEHATVLSNWCRVIWRMRCEENVHNNNASSYLAGLREVLRIRSSLLPWDHPDVAAAHFNLATAEYNRRNNAEAVFHLKQYLRVASSSSSSSYSSSSRRNNSETTTNILDPMPAMIYLLLLQNENRPDSMSKELVRALRTLQNKRQPPPQQVQQEGNDNADSSSQEVASVLNFIGTLLFHKGDLDDALVFFLEELRLEELCVATAASSASSASKAADDEEDMSVAVTCNNIGRIFQERGKYDQAIAYYERALKPVYGDDNILDDNEPCATKHSNNNNNNNNNASELLDAASKNLYSTVWYNLGLIHDKSAAYPQAIGCFQKSLELRLSILGRDHPDVACLHFNIGVLQTEQQQLDEAAVSLKEALRARAACSAGGNTASSNKLSDHRFIKTLERLATLQKNKGNNAAAVDAWSVVLDIMEVSSDIDAISRIEYMALVLRSISELHHAAGDLKAALMAALQSGRKLEALCAAYYGSSKSAAAADNTSKLVHIEQLVSALLLVGSLHHEMCEPLKADAILGQATLVLEYAAKTTLLPSSLPASLLALREVASMLVTERSAPQA